VKESQQERTNARAETIRKRSRNVVCVTSVESDCEDLNLQPPTQKEGVETRKETNTMGENETEELTERNRKIYQGVRRLLNSEEYRKAEG